VNWLKGGFRAIGSDEIDRGQYDEERDVKSGSTGVLVHTSFFAEVGLMDEKHFPLYWADVDFLYRAYKMGYRIIYQPRSKIWHKLFSTIKKSTPAPTSFWATFVYLTTDKKAALNFRKIIRFWLRHCPWYLIPYVFLRYAALILLKSKRHNILRMKMPKHAISSGKEP
jgi:GT2 family glycosyltransferase